LKFRVSAIELEIESKNDELNNLVWCRFDVQNKVSVSNWIRYALLLYYFIHYLL